MTTIRVLDIIKGTMADGPGIRNSIYVAGCAHKCPGCHNPESWDFRAGRTMTIGEILEEVLEEGTDITISGGDPVYQADSVTRLCRLLKAAGKNIWLFTGFTYDQVALHSPELLLYIDVLVDGPYKAELRDTSNFKGSTNQRILYLKNGKIEKIEQ